MRALWVPVGVAATLHLVLLTSSDSGLGALQAQPVPTVMQVRAVAVATPIDVIPVPVEPSLPATIAAMATTQRLPVSTETSAVEKSQPAQGAQSITAPTSPPVIDDELQAPWLQPSSGASPKDDAAPVQVAATPIPADVIKNVAAPSGAAEVAVPVYRTVMPPPATLRFELRKGIFPGSGELVWKPSADRYEVRLEGSVAGMNLLTQTSVGTLDAHGIAPSRYTDARSRRGTNAANFQRDKGKITYSGPQVEYPLFPGTQDRVSWMIQIGAILNADPKLATPEGKISMFVSGANGDADVWVFQYVGAESLHTDFGMVQTVKFTRLPRKAYDRSVEVWLAPVRNHLPIRARFTANAGGDAFELLLRDIHSP